MKLLHCKSCNDVFALRLNTRKCECGKTQGRYLINDVNAEYSGEDAVPIGFNNRDFELAIESNEEMPIEDDFRAFVVSSDCPTFKKVPR